MLGHLGLNVDDLAKAKAYYDQLMPHLGYVEFLSADDQFAFMPADGKRGTSAEVHPPQDWPQYPPPYFAAFWLDRHGFMIEAVCHHDR